MASIENPVGPESKACFSFSLWNAAFLLSHISLRCNSVNSILIPQDKESVTDNPSVDKYNVDVAEALANEALVTFFSSLLFVYRSSF